MEGTLKFNKKLFLIISISVFLVLSTIMVLTALNGGALDLKIAKSLVEIPEGTRYSEDIFGRIIKLVGEMPIYLVGLFTFYGFEYAVRDIEKKRKFINFLRLGCLGAGLILGTLMGHRICKYIYIIANSSLDQTWCNMLSISLFVTIPFSLLLNFSFYKWVNKLRLDKKAMLHISLVAIIAILTATLSVEFFKLVIRRNRYRSILLLTGGDFETYFTPWYKRGTKIVSDLLISDDRKSFPSGHAQSSTALLFLTLLPFYFKEFNNKKAKLICFIVPPIYVLMVMFGRILVGAHYLSDVTCGVLIGSLLFAVCFYIDQMLLKKNIANQTI